MHKLKGKKVLVVGLGKSGLSMVRYLVQEGAKVTVSDSKSKSELADQLKIIAEMKVEFELGKHNGKTFTSAELIILSPGVPTSLPELAEARAAGIPITNDIELAYPLIKAPIIAVTGTNGKTTTTALISEMLKNDGRTVFTGGNIGTPVFDMILENQNPDFVVLELSSFQLETIQNFKAKINVFTNLEPDHLDRYPNGVESYYSAKKRLIAKADAESSLIINLDNDASYNLKNGFPGKIVYFTKINPMLKNAAEAENFQGAYYQKPRIVMRLDGKEEIIEMILCKLPGDHNRENIMAAALAAKLVGCSKAAIQKTAETFKGVSHRLEFIRKKDGVVFYNDSKATNVASVMRSLSSFGTSPLILIAGGRDKDQDFAPLLDLVKKRVKNLILVGEAKEKINRVIGDFSETFLVGTFEEGVLLAFQKSRTGDIILLSPACASYDMFKSFEERGDYFKKLVSQL